MTHSYSRNIRPASLARRSSVAALVTMICFLTLAAFTESLDTWKEALSAMSSDKGPESIPYSSLRSDARSSQNLVDDLDDEWTCKGLGTKGLRKEISDRTTHIASLKEQARKLDEQIASYTKELAEQELSLKTDLSDLDIRMAKGRKVLEARKAVQRAFQEAISKAKSENDPEIKEIATKLIGYWEKGYERHQGPIKDVENGIEYGQKCKNGDE